MCVVIFDYAAWAARYPELAASVDEAAATRLFDEVSTLYLINTDRSKVTDCTERAVLLNMLVAHVAALNARAVGGSSAAGAIGSATEGSVSVSFNLSAIPGSAAWYSQTGYGLSYWQATAKYRRARYISSC